MCRMAIVLSDKALITGLDLRMYRAWKASNKDGVGVLFIDESNNFHLERFEPRTEQYKPIEQNYSRLFIHFREGTGGKGTHLFTCSKAPNWYLAHNGRVDEREMRLNLERLGHVYRTEIDSETLIHLWGESILRKRRKDTCIDVAIDLLNKIPKGSGRKNIILYNPQTDEWVTVFDRSMLVVKKKKFVLLSSDLKWLKEVSGNRLGSGTVLYGRGPRILGQAKWSR